MNGWSEIALAVCYNVFMSKVLIIGNVLKDVYLKLDQRQNEFEKDENGIDWLDLRFNGASHHFFHRTSVYGGAAVSLSVLSRLGIDAKILGSRTEFKDGEITWQDEPGDYRYILCHDGGITYFVPSSRKTTDWEMPSGTPEWILVDRSTAISARLVDGIKNFMKFSPTTKLAVHVEKHLSPVGQKLAGMADILFVENEPPVHDEEKIVDKIEVDKPNSQLVCHISPRKITLGDAEESWQLNRTDMLTHLTVYSTIVATVLGVISVGGTAADAVLWARLNAERSTLESSLSARKLQELAKAESDKRANVKLMAKSLMAARHGVFAVDQSERTLTERLINFSIPATAKTRQAYRDLLLTTPELRDYVSGVILTPEVGLAKVDRRENYVSYLTGRGLIVGVKAETGQAKLDGADEMVTLGLEDLAARLKQYYDDGFRFAKWRAVFGIGKNRPGYIAIRQNVEQIAFFARESQLAGMVPVIESQVEYAGDYTIEQSIEVTDRILVTLFEKLEQKRVDLSSCILKTNMVTSGKDAIAKATPKEVGLATAAVLRHAVPKYLAGVLLLSGGQDAKTATQNLTAIYQNGPFPWPVSFAFGQALQDSVMATWKGDAKNLKAAQAALRRHLQDNTEAIR